MILIPPDHQRLALRGAFLYVGLPLGVDNGPPSTAIEAARVGHSGKLKT